MHGAGAAARGGDYADAAGTQPLTQQELTLPKLTPTEQKAEDADKKQSPRTADAAVPALALAAMVVAGAGAVLIRRKKQ